MDELVANFRTIKQFEELAKRKLDTPAYRFYACGATDEETLRENRTAFSRLLLNWRVLRGVTEVDLTTTIQGRNVGSPICVAPTGFQRMAHPDGEAATARACASSNTLTTLSTMCNCSIEEVAAAGQHAGRGTQRWFQLYIMTDRKAIQELVEIAESCGYSAITLTVDCAWLGNRTADICVRHPLNGEFLKATARGSGQMQVDVSFDKSLCWDDIDWLKSITKLPIILKGIMTAEDARLAVKKGVSGIWVSNHGARQLDTTPATIEVLPEIVDAVNGQVEVYLDGGVRNGGDVLKALALGARAVFVGRPALWGLACNGEAGVCQVLELLNKELEISLALCGCSSVRDIPRSIVVPAAKYRSSL